MSVVSVLDAMSSSVGRKIVVAFTGLFLTVFLLVHCYVNLNLLFLHADENFNRAAHFMGSNLLVRIAEIGLFVGLITHIYQGLYLHFSNLSKRKVKYAITPGNKSSKWYSRSMGLFGTIILLFLLVHLWHFWVPSRFSGELEKVEYAGLSCHNLYEQVTEVFAQPFVVILYVLGCVSLGLHLYHGVQSACRTFGVYKPAYLSWIRCLSLVYALAIPALFALMPVFVYFDIHLDIGSIQLSF